MPKMPKNKMVSKKCHKCEQQVPVACKACPCGHVFFVTRRPISIHKTGGANGSTEEVGEVKRRRTERIKRERPDFYNAMEIESQLRKLHRRSRNHKSSTSTSTSTADFDDGIDDDQQAVCRKRGRGRPKIGTKKPLLSEASEQEEVMANITPAKAAQYSLILSEINNKISMTQFRV